MTRQQPVVGSGVGMVRSVDVAPGGQADAGTVLAEIEQETE